MCNAHFTHTHVSEHSIISHMCTFCGVSIKFDALMVLGCADTERRRHVFIIVDTVNVKNTKHAH